MKQMKKTMIASVILTVVIITTAILIYLGIRETRVTVRSEGFGNLPPQLTVSIALGDVKVIEEIRQQYLSSLEPRRAQLARIDEQLAHISETLAEMESVKTEFEKTLVKTGEEFESKAKQAWDDASSKLEEEYELRKLDTIKKYEDKAQSLQLNFKKPKLDSVDAYSSAFRLGLYNAATNINAEAERKWADENFQEWMAYEKEWQQRMDKAMIKGRIIDDKKRNELAKMKVDAPIVENKREPLTQQRARLQIEKDQIQTYLDNASEPYMERILSLYRATAIKTIPVDTKGEAVFANLDLAPGSYFIIAESTGEPEARIWRIPFLIRGKQNNVLIIKPDNGRTLRDILDNGL